MPGQPFVSAWKPALKAGAPDAGGIGAPPPGHGCRGA